MVDDEEAAATAATRVVHGDAGESASGVAGDSTDHAHAHAASTLHKVAEDIQQTVGDGEDAVVGVLDDLLDDIFADFRVTEENQKSVLAAVAYAWRQALESCVMSANSAPETMDAGYAEPTNDGGPWQLFLRPRIDEEGTTHRKHGSHGRNRAHAPVVAFLSGLWTVLDKQPTFVQSQLALFPSSRFHVSSVPTHGRTDEWEISVSDFGGFLTQLIHTARLSAVATHAVEYIVRVNATFLDKKAKAKSKLQLPQISMCVQSAFLAAEEEDQQDQSQRALEKTQATISQVFQTAIEDHYHHQEESSMDDDEDELFTYYDEGSDFDAATVDRNATGKVACKRELHSTIAKKIKIKKSIVSLLQRRKSYDVSTKWGAVRKRVLNNGGHMGIAIESDMTLLSSSSSSSSPATERKQSTSNGSPKKKQSSALLAAGAASSSGSFASRPSPIKTFPEPDTAALANIFSLGTPRQLSSDEMARRNDILSLLEREEAHSHRKMAVASFIAMAVPSTCVGSDGKPILSEHDADFQAYAAANSSITTTSGSCVVPSTTPAAAAVSEDGATKLKPPSESQEPQRKRSGPTNKTKFELALEPPPFDVVDGDAHALMAAAAAAAAAASSPPPGKKTKGGPRGHMKSPSPATALTSPAKPLPPQPPSIPADASHDHHHVRPLETASGHLPQLETSRLAVGVKAVQRGVEKRGPRHDPSRNSRLRLHNYTTTSDEQHDPAPGVSTAKTTTAVSPSPAAPAKPPADHLPPVSPIKASPHRKHVTFPTSPVKSPDPMLATASPPPLPLPPSGSRRFPVKQPAYENKTSPPRVRNRHLMETNSRSHSNKKKHLTQQRWRQQQEQEQDQAEAQDDSVDKTLLHAPRRNLVMPSSTDDNEE